MNGILLYKQKIFSQFAPLVLVNIKFLMLIGGGKVDYKLVPS